MTMDPALANLGWTEDQWNQICSVVTEEAQKARVAAQILPTVGPEDRSAVSFADYRLGTIANPIAPPPARRLTTNNFPDHPLTTIAAQVALSSAEIADPGLEAAFVKFRRAANVIARLEDAVVFNDRITRGVPLAGIRGVPQIFQVTGGGPAPGTAVELGLLPLDLGVGPRTPIASRGRVVVAPPFARPVTPAMGQRIADGIVAAMSQLEASGQSSAFACALSPLFYEAVYSPSPNFVAARDRILPILNGPLVRSSAITDVNAVGAPNPYGVVIALGGTPVSLRVTVDISVRFLQLTSEPRALFRVSERIGLRVTDPSAIVVLTTY
jgi:uncharacterized linocin/CFP29 family protein